MPRFMPKIGVAPAEIAVQGLQHQPVAAQRHDDLGLGRRNGAIALFQRGLGGAGGLCRRGNESKAGSGGGGHQSALLSVQESYYSDPGLRCDKIPGI